MVEVEKLYDYYARLSVDGDKSITVRAVILGALASGQTIVRNPLICADTLAAIKCVKTLGAAVEAINEKGDLRITGVKNPESGCVFDCENSGTTARLLIGALAGLNIEATVIGDQSLSGRPMDRIINPLIKRGAKIESENGFLPVKIHPAKLTDFVYESETDSAQVKGGILLSGVTSNTFTRVIEKNKTRPHTEDMLKSFGADVKVFENEIVLNRRVRDENSDSLTALKGCEVCVPSDLSAAAFYIAIGLLCGEVTVPNVPLIDTRTGFYEILIKAGASVFYENARFENGYKTVDVTARKSKIDYFEITSRELPSLIDELPLIAAVAAFNGGAKIKGAGELKIKESDRLNGTCALINAAGGKACVSGDDLIVSPGANFKKYDYRSNDHRMIMTAFVVMSAGDGGVLNGEEYVNVSFPNFFANLNDFKCALFGENVKKSFSGAIHKFVSGAFGKENFSYRQISCGLEEFVSQLKKPAYKLINATYPFKDELFLGSKICEKNVEIIKSANFCLDGAAYSTDGAGLLYALCSAGIKIKGKNVLVIGAGGAGRSVAYEFAKAGANVFVCNRTKEKAISFSAECAKAGVKVLPFFCDNAGGKEKTVEKFDVIINATPSGDPQGINDEVFKFASVAADINYKKPSAFLEKADKFGAKIFDGESMLFFQAYVFDCVVCGKKPKKAEGKRLLSAFKEKYAHLL